MTEKLQFFGSLSTNSFANAGGKGSLLARLYQHGYPVPDGFIVLEGSFGSSGLTESGWQAVSQAALDLGKDPGALFAVRSSARDEDSAEASFAGSFDSRLNVTIGDLKEAVHAVWQSSENERVKSYAQSHGLSSHSGMAVIVQRMVPAQLSGVVFTADPVSGSRERMVGNYIPGYGDQLVSGEADAGLFEITRPDGRLSLIEPIHSDGLLKAHATALFKLASSLETLLNGPQDIEWAIADDRLYLLQARPITTLASHNPATGEWNDTRLGDYLWTNTNFGEALPDVMTPLTWSAVKVYFHVNRIGIENDALPMGGNIAGRLYMNISLAATFLTGLGFSEKKMRLLAAETFGTIPDEVDIPRQVLSRWEILKSLVPNALRRMRLVSRLKKQVPAFIQGTPARVSNLVGAINAAGSAAELLDLWQRSLAAELDHALVMLAAGTSDYKNQSRKLRARLSDMVGEGETNALMSGNHPGSDLASLGPLVGLTRLSRGELSRHAFIQHYGHRGPSEFELSLPTPGESDPLLDQQLAEIARNPTSASDLLAARQKLHAAAWDRLATAFPRQAVGIRRDLARLTQASQSREAVRSEVVRLYRVLRVYALRAAELTGVGADIFYLSLEEVAALLAGDRAALGYIESRRETDRRYRSLPPYPAIIRGRFDAQRWAQDPRRRSDIFDPAQETISSDAVLLEGFPGSPGVVEAFARVLQNPAQGATFQAGEILVANTTNVGWTPLFPRAAAIVTDIGAPLSHAAIVARELGIPAVVGTGSATTRLRTGDRLRVNGGKGTVEILET